MQISPLSSKGIDFCRTILCMQIVFYHMPTTAPIAQENLVDETVYGYIINLFSTKEMDAETAGCSNRKNRTIYCYL